MLIDEAIEAAKAANKLFPVKSIAPWAPEPRAFLMCLPLYSALEQGRSHADEAARKQWARLEAAMLFFVEGGMMNEKLIKQLQPPKYEHWELISRRPKPSLRVFGRFAKPDVFIGTHVKERKEMGGMWSPQFEHEKLICEDHWKAAGLLRPFTDPPKFRYESYITENATKEVQVSS